MSRLSDALDMVDSTLYAWEQVKENFIDGDLDELLRQGKWVLHYAKTKGWYL